MYLFYPCLFHATKERETCLNFDTIGSSLWLQNVLNINSWPHCMKGGTEVQALGIKEVRERVADVTRIIT